MRVPLQQVPRSPEPCQERGDGSEIEPGQFAAVRMGHMDAVLNVQVRQMQVRAPGYERQHAQAETEQKANQVKIQPVHERLPGACGFNTSINRSAKPGFSKISPS